MAIGQTLNILEQRLHRVADKVFQVKLDVIGSGRAAGTGGSDPGQAARVRRLNQKLAGVYAEMEQILNMLGQIGAQLDQRERIAWRVGREFRYRARQSIRSHASRQRELYQLVDDILRDIDDLLRGTGALTTADIVNLGNGLKGQFSQYAQHIQEAKALLTQPSGPAFTAPNVTVNVDWVTMVFMVFILLVSLREKFRRHDDA
jgi:hypothetical protein